MTDHPRQRIRWRAYPDVTTLQADVLDAIRQSAESALRERGRFAIVLAGGNTPKAIYTACRQLTTDWTQWHVYFGDERCLPATDAERNAVMAHAAWLSHVPIPAAQIHAIPAERGPVEAARAYADILRTVGEFDFVLLGLGEDGHTASLFPGHPWGEQPTAADALAVFDAPKPPPERVSLSAQRLSHARRIAFVVSGEGKRTALAAWHNEDPDQIIPARAIAPAGTVEVFYEHSLLASPQ